MQFTFITRAWTPGTICQPLALYPTVPLLYHEMDQSTGWLSLPSTWSVPSSLRWCDHPVNLSAFGSQPVSSYPKCSNPTGQPDTRPSNSYPDCNNPTGPPDTRSSTSYPDYSNTTVRPTRSDTLPIPIMSKMGEFLGPLLLPWWRL